MGRYEIVSGPDIIGEDEYAGGYDDVEGHQYDVGASPAYVPSRRQPPRPMYHPQQRMMPKPLATGPGGTKLMGKTQHDNLRRQIAPLPITVLSASTGTTALQTISVQVQRVFRVERVNFNSSLNALSQTVITQINVGQDPQFVNSGAVPISAFFATSFGLTLRGNTAYPGLTITISVQNLGPSEDTITGMIVGEAIPQ